MSNAARVEFSASFGLDPLYWSDVKLLLCHVHELHAVTSAPSTFVLCDHPIRRVHIVGIIVAVRVRRHCVDLTLDDSTALIDVTVWTDNDTPTRNTNIGDAVRVIGNVKTFRTRLYVHAHVVTTVDEPHSELLHWSECIGLYQNIVQRASAVAAERISSEHRIHQQIIGAVAQAKLRAFSGASLLLHSGVRETALAITSSDVNTSADDESALIGPLIDSAMRDLLSWKWIAAFDDQRCLYQRDVLYRRTQDTDK